MPGIRAEVDLGQYRAERLAGGVADRLADGGERGAHRRPGGDRRGEQVRDDRAPVGPAARAAAATPRVSSLLRQLAERRPHRPRPGRSPSGPPTDSRTPTAATAAGDTGRCDAHRERSGGRSATGSPSPRSRRSRGSGAGSTASSDREGDEHRREHGSQHALDGGGDPSRPPGAHRHQHRHRPAGRSRPGVVLSSQAQRVGPQQHAEADSHAAGALPACVPSHAGRPAGPPGSRGRPRRLAPRPPGASPRPPVPRPESAATCQQAASWPSTGSVDGHPRRVPRRHRRRVGSTAAVAGHTDRLTARAHQCGQRRLPRLRARPTARRVPGPRARGPATGGVARPGRVRSARPAPVPPREPGRPAPRDQRAASGPPTGVPGRSLRQGMTQSQAASPTSTMAASRAISLGPSRAASRRIPTSVLSTPPRRVSAGTVETKPDASRSSTCTPATNRPPDGSRARCMHHVDAGRHQGVHGQPVEPGRQARGPRAGRARPPPSSRAPCRTRPRGRCSSRTACRRPRRRGPRRRRGDRVACAAPAGPGRAS